MADPRRGCEVEKVLEMISGRWKVLVLRELFEGVRRFGEIQRALGGVSQKVLARQLKELERDGLIARRPYPEVPPRVEYSLTPLGTSLRPVILAMHEWSIAHLGGERAENEARGPASAAPG